LKQEWPNVCIAHPSIFTALEIERFEAEILSNPRATEKDASEFFAHFPKCLLLGQGKEIRRETVLIGSNDDPIGRVDFFRKTFGRQSWDLIELKQPHIRVISGVNTSHPYLSASVQKAVSQVQDYRQWIDDSPELRSMLDEKGIYVCHPRMMVVAGRDHQGVLPELVAELSDRIQRAGVELLTYDGLLSFAKEHYRSNRIIVLAASVNSAVAPWAIFRKELSGSIISANDEFLRCLGMSLAMVIGKTDFDFYPGELAKMYLADDRRVMQTGLRLENDEESVGHNGERILVRIIKTPVRDPSGRIVGVECRFRRLSRNSWTQR
jgi:PAS domain S-box-containing protein